MTKTDQFDKDNEQTIIATLEKSLELRIVCAKSEVKPVEYEEALNLTGASWYNIGLLATLTLTILGMAIDMFGFSIIVVGAACDFDLDLQQKGLLISAPFLGAISMAYPWGYISDTQGRRKSLLISTSVSFLASFISVFSPNWIMLGILKLISTSFCSCAQSVTYALLGESCPEKIRGKYSLVMSSLLMATPAMFYIPGYFILKMEYPLNLGFVALPPWRLLILVLIIPLGLSAVLLTFHYESPKFLANAGREEEALQVLIKIWKRNGGGKEGNKFPVEKIVLNEVSTVRSKDTSLLKSLWVQTAPLFKPPLLWHSLKLYYITFVNYSVNNGFLMWYPFIINSFFAGVSTNGEEEDKGLCYTMVSQFHATSNNTVPRELVSCTSSLEFRTTVASISQSLSFMTVNLVLSKFALWKKTLLLIIFTESFIAGIASTFISNNLVSLVVFVFIMSCCLATGFLCNFFIDLYPTSHRGMAICLSVMVARGSALTAINLVGAYLINNCTTSFYIASGALFSALAVSLTLPSDRVKKEIK